MCFVSGLCPLQLIKRLLLFLLSKQIFLFFLKFVLNQVMFDSQLGLVGFSELQHQSSLPCLNLQVNFMLLLFDDLIMFLALLYFEFMHGLFLP